MYRPSPGGDATLDIGRRIRRLALKSADNSDAAPNLEEFTFNFIQAAMFSLFNEDGTSEGSPVAITGANFPSEAAAIIAWVESVC